MLEALILTLLIEIPLLAAFGLRGRNFVFFSVFVNIMTNVGINAFLLIIFYLNPTFVSSKPVYWATVAILEILVVAVEYIVFREFLRKGGKTLFFITAAVNFASFCFGLLVPSIRNIAGGLPDWSFVFVF